MHNYIIYLLFLIINLYLIYLYNLAKKQSKQILWITILINIILFGIIRFDTGNDYVNYVTIYHQLLQSEEWLSINYLILNLLTKFFSFNEYGYIGVFAVYFILTIFIISSVLRKYNILFWGFFTFVTFGLLFDSFDRIRQMAAVAIFISALQNIEKKQLIVFCFKILIASLFHISAIILIPFYFISQIKINKIFLSILIFILTIGYFLGFWSQLVKYIYSVVPYYKDIYANTKYSEQFIEINSGFGLLGKILFIYLNILLCPLNRIYKNLLSIGLIIYIIGIGNLNIERIADYFIYICIITFPFIISKYKKIENIVFIVTPMILFLLILFLKNINDGKYFSYQTIFSLDFKKQEFQKRNFD